MHMNRDIDQVVRALRSAYPTLAVEQLRVTHPCADDDGLWFFRHPRCPTDVQLESSTGAAPFLIESDGQAPSVVRTVQEAIEAVAQRLGLS
jgi:hypothetical protein